MLDAFAAQVHVPYMIMAGVAGVSGDLDRALEAAGYSAEDANRSAGTDARAASSAFRTCGSACCACFFYVGVEVMAGDAIGTYGRGFDLPLDETKFFTSFTLIAMLVGYVAGLLLIPRFVSQQRYLASRPRSACVLDDRRLPDQRLMCRSLSSPRSASPTP